MLADTENSSSGGAAMEELSFGSFSDLLESRGDLNDNATMHSLGLVYVYLVHVALTKGDMIIVQAFFSVNGQRPDLIGTTVRIEGTADVTALPLFHFQAND
jgi:hypothetical protein